VKKVLIFFIILIFVGVVSAQQISISLGPEEVVFDWTTQKCAQDDIPDSPARAFRDINGNVQLIASHYTNRRFVGSSLNTINNTCPIIMSSSLNSDPAQYNDHEWITAPYTFDGQIVYTLVHNEYHGHLYTSSCPNYQSCWYNSITFATSTNAGVTYTQTAAPNHLVASIPWQYANNANSGAPYGYFAPSNIIKKDGYYYSFLQVEPYQNFQTWGSCPMRTQNLADPTSWRFWDGTGFNNVPVNPYLTSVTNPSNHICQPVSQMNLLKFSNSLTYNNYLGKYIMVGVWENPSNPTQGGFYFSLSTDLINWGAPQFLMSAVLPWMPAGQYAGGQYYVYPSLLEETSSRNFEVTGQTPYLYYTRKNANPTEPTYDRDLVRRQVTFTLNPPPQSFNFNLVSSENISSNPGNSLITNVTANLVSGNPQPVNFSASGLPAGASYSFNSGSCTPNCVAQLTITTTSSTPVGNYPIAVTGTGGGITRTTNFVLEIKDNTPPSIPSSHYSAALSQNQIQLTWGAATDNVGVTGYLVDVSPSASFASYVTGWQANNLGNVLSTTVSGLNPGTTYYFRVRARDAAGNLGAYSQFASATTTNAATMTTNSNTFVISEPSQYISGVMKYSWAGNPEIIKILVNELPPIESIEFGRASGIFSREVLISAYGSVNDLPEDIRENYNLNYFFAIDSMSFSGDIILNLKIPLDEINARKPTFIAIKERESIWEMQQIEMTSQDDSFAYYSTQIPAEAKYVIAFEKEGKEKYWVLGVIIILVAVVVAVAIKVMKPKRI